MGYDDIDRILGFWSFFEPNVILDKAPIVGFLNPFLGIIMNIRGIVMDSYDMNMYWLWVNLLYSFVFYLIGVFVFKKFGGLALEKL